MPENDPFAALERAAARQAAERAGARVTDLALPAELAQAWERHRIIQNYEGRLALAWEYDTQADALPPRVREHLDAGEAFSPAQYDDARRHAHRARRVLKSLFTDYDAILTFSAPGPAPATLAFTGDPRFNQLWTLMGVPCVNVPGYVDAAGLPVGVQVIAPFGRDAAALAAARFVEEAIRPR
jgi:Asp-tRNA(Asn)/Glu-tRNA(Gln) amidotransferase A subunit family amidase